MKKKLFENNKLYIFLGIVLVVILFLFFSKLTCQSVLSDFLSLACGDKNIYDYCHQTEKERMKSFCKNDLFALDTIKCLLIFDNNKKIKCHVDALIREKCGLIDFGKEFCSGETGCYNSYQECRRNINNYFVRIVEGLDICEEILYADFLETKPEKEDCYLLKMTKEYLSSINFNPRICDKFTKERRGDCYDKIILEKSIYENNYLLCDEIEDEDKREKCRKDSYELNIIRGDCPPNLIKYEGKFEDFSFCYNQELLGEVNEFSVSDLGDGLQYEINFSNNSDLNILFQPADSANISDMETGLAFADAVCLKEKTSNLPKRFFPSLPKYAPALYEQIKDCFINQAELLNTKYIDPDFGDSYLFLIQSDINITGENKSIFQFVALDVFGENSYDFIVGADKNDFPQLNDIFASFKYKN